MDYPTFFILLNSAMRSYELYDPNLAARIARDAAEAAEAAEVELQRQLRNHRRRFAGVVSALHDPESDTPPPVTLVLRRGEPGHEWIGLGSDLDSSNTE